MNIKFIALFFRRRLFSVLWLGLLSLTVCAQQKKDDRPKPRDIVPVFETARPPSEGSGSVNPTAAAQANKPPRPVYSRISQKINSGKVGKQDRPGRNRPPRPSNQKPPADIQTAKAQQIGITLWKLLAANYKDLNISTDDSESLSQINAGKTRYLTPVRVPSDTLFESRDYVRMAIEAAKEGYLYIVDQEMYADGTTGDAYLVFPNKRLRGGENAVAAGSPIEIPDLTSNPFYFELRPQSENGKPIMAEVLSIIITDTPIAGLKIGDRPLLVSNQMLNGWRTKWAGRTEIFESSETARRGYTKIERQAADGKQKLTRTDPLPQTVFLVEGNRNNGMLITVPLWYGKEE